MSGSVFVIDQYGQPLMPMSAAYARRLLKDGKAVRVPHHAFTIVQLTYGVPNPGLRAVTLGISIELNIIELIIATQTRRGVNALLHVLIDMRTDISWRMRRRAGHRRRRRARGRYRAPRRYGQPFKLRRPSLAMSSWAKLHRRQQSAPRYAGYNATIRWRAQAVVRVINMLRRWIPISEVMLLPSSRHFSRTGETAGEQASMQRLSENNYPCCAYCGTHSLRLELDHVVPRSRGGSDAITNLVFACPRCNSIKADRTPQEAAMPVRFAPQRRVFRLRQAAPYRVQTTSLLCMLLLLEKMTVTTDSEIGYSWLNALPGHVQSFIAKPIGRPTKQRFTAHNYSPSSQRHHQIVHFKRVVKRRTQVNTGLSINNDTSHPTVIVHKAGEDAPPSGSIRLGMLSQAIRHGLQVIGIVSAIHSTGRITLNAPSHIEHWRIFWKRIVVSPRQSFRVLSTDRIIFFPYDPASRVQRPLDKSG